MRTRVMRLMVVVGLLLFGVGVIQGQEEIPTNRGYVTDVADQFTPQQEQQLVQQMERIERELDVVIAVGTINDCGADPATYTSQVFNTWQPGNAVKDNGLLIVLCLTARSIEQEAGIGIEEKFTGKYTGDAAQEFFIPSARDGKMFQGVTSLLNYYERDLSGIVTQPQQAVSKKDNTAPFYTPAKYVCAGFLLLLILAVIFGGSSESGSGSYSGGSNNSSSSSSSRSSSRSSSSSSSSSRSSSNRGGSSGGSKSSKGW